MGDQPDDRDVSIGEVNRNLNQFRLDYREDIREIKNGFVTRDQLKGIEGRLSDLENNAKSKITNSISIVAIIASTGIGIWAVIHG